ncbi:hypothetical protein [Streptomyces sp. NRRL S-1448]|uniref:hypothetical protein n=1 Tax=Streptomyces sp. NRRL S-1448 TaxID=1463883 RepID=UPI003B63499E
MNVGPANLGPANLGPANLGLVNLGAGNLAKPAAVGRGTRPLRGSRTHPVGVRSAPSEPQRGGRAGYSRAG